MTRWSAPVAWLGGPSLSTGIIIETREGVITAIGPGSGDTAQRLDGIVLPGLVNTHSHAFHRLLRGRTHRQGGDFWVWREKMYDVAASLTPESYEEIATAVFIEMALAGITTVGEFHYVHHQPGGMPYAEPNEMGEAVVRAARRAGIGICLLDAGYFSAGFGDRPLSPVQKRFRDPTAEDWVERASALAS
jgi:cytosine/adenosine deaminase-related metal-dependent hydrolase